MPILPLAFPPGMVRTSTISDSTGRWYDGNLVRWMDGVLQPWGGWSLAEGASSVSSKPVRGMLGWRTETSPYLRLAMGTYQGAFVWFPETGTTWDITPASGFSSGRQNASSGVEASCWIFDTWDSGDLLGVMHEDGDLWIQTSTGPTDDFVVATGAPTGNSAVVVTPEKFVVLLAADRNPRLVQWCDQDDITEWSPDVSNQAGDFTLPGSGWLMNGKRGRGETLLWTDTDLWAMRYIGGELVYSFTQVGAACGPASRRSMAIVDGKAIWMGRRGFYTYDGFTSSLPCAVADYVFNRLNLVNMSKVAAVPNPDFNEITWYYPSGSSSTAECDSYVTYDYVQGTWAVGFIGRSDGIERMFFDGPYLAGTTGALYLHESGTTMTEEGGSSYTPYAESGPLQWENGERVFTVLEYVPDGKTTTGVTLTVYGAFHPTATETTFGPFTGANPTSVRLTARQVRVKAIQSTAAWRLGTPSLNITIGGRR